MALAMTERPIGFRPWEISAMVNMEVVAQHAEDAAFLWFSRDRAVRAPHYYLKDLVRLDERVEANIDGLRVAGEVGWDLASEALKQEGPGELFAAAVLAFETKKGERLDVVFEAIGKQPSLARAAISAFGWMRFEDAKPLLDELAHSPHPYLRRVAIGGFAVHRADPRDPLRNALTDPDVDLRIRAFQAADELGRTELAYSIARHIGADNPQSSFWAAWSAARLGLRGYDVTDVLRRASESDAPYADAALQMFLRCLQLPQSHEWISATLKDSKRQRRGVQGVGIVGDPARVSELIGYMQIEALSRVAGEAFSMITGVDLKYIDLDRPKPESFEAGPTDNPEDTDVAMDQDEDLPWPAPDLVRKWWDKHQDEFQPGVRYLRGKPIEPANLTDTLKNGYQRQRAAAALELALLRPSDPLFEARAPGRRQQEALAQWNS
jgi:uncharacterized protein (TIGR02270 family)